MKRHNGVDIIIPVYNALEDLKICLESLKRHTDLTLDRVIMIDDRSPDTQVYPFMQSVEAEGIVVLQNEQNQGFSGTVNRGMAFSDRDVILLNSDTIVTENWVDKIVQCAYSDAAIGTVTPFSNNATLCSIPNFCQENTIPYGLSIDEYARIVERNSLRKYPRITVAVGFCMFIKRETIRTVGMFDQKTFEKGYGEENDYCWRAEQLGYYHVLCDDTYIYHSGSASFVSQEKKKLMEDHERILQGRYPKQIQENAEYVRDNPHQYLRNNVDMYARLKNGKKNLLYVLHSDFRQDAANSIGGTQFHVKDLTNNLREQYNIFVAARDERWLRLTIYLAEEQISLRFLIGKQPHFQQFHNEQIAEVLKQVLCAFEIDMVHVHHISMLSFDIFHIVHSLGIPLLLTLHDYFYVCPTTTLLENGAQYCAGQGKDCAQCLKRQLGYSETVNYLPVWREKCAEALTLCDILFAPSNSVKATYETVYPEIAGRIQVVPHGMDAFSKDERDFGKANPEFCYAVESAFRDDYTISGWAFQQGVDSSSNEVTVALEDTAGKRETYRSMRVSRLDVANAHSNDLYRDSGFQIAVPDCGFADGDLKMQIVLRNAGKEYYSDIITVSGYKTRKKQKKRIAFLGGLNEAKGSNRAYQMITQSGSKYEWYLIGGIGDPNLITLSAPNVHKIGWYMRENVAAILQQNQIDLVCILPICPETFCYTLSEAQLSGVPVLASDIGALSERMRKDGTGWLIPAGADAKYALNTLESVFAEQEKLEEIQQRTERFTHRTIVQMCEAYDEIYKSIPLKENTAGTFDAQMIYNGWILGERNQSGNSTDLDLIRQVNELETTLYHINQSLEYRMVKFFNREKMPFKRQIKWLIGFAYRVYTKLKYRR